MTLYRLHESFIIFVLDLHFVSPLGKPITAHLQGCQGFGFTTASPSTPCIWVILDFRSIKVWSHMLLSWNKTGYNLQKIHIQASPSFAQLVQASIAIKYHGLLEKFFAWLYSNGWFHVKGMNLLTNLSSHKGYLLQGRHFKCILIFREIRLGTADRLVRILDLNWI